MKVSGTRISSQKSYWRLGYPLKPGVVALRLHNPWLNVSANRGSELSNNKIKL